MFHDNDDDLVMQNIRKIDDSYEEFNKIFSITGNKNKDKKNNNDDDDTRKIDNSYDKQKKKKKETNISLYKISTPDDISKTTEILKRIESTYQHFSMDFEKSSLEGQFWVMWMGNPVVKCKFLDKAIESGQSFEGSFILRGRIQDEKFDLLMFYPYEYLFKREQPDDNIFQDIILYMT